jgi:hypothetical protein
MNAEFFSALSSRIFAWSSRNGLSSRLACLNKLKEKSAATTLAPVRDAH